jgi:transposase
MDKRFLEECLADGMSLEQIGRRAGKHPSTVSHWLGKYGLEANGAARHSPNGRMSEQLLEIAVEEGLTLREMGWEFDRSVSTVRRWLRLYGLPTHSGVRDRSKKFVDPAGTRVRMECRHHGVTEFVMEGRGYYRCVRCRCEAVARRRRDVKRILIEEAGGGCALCGYDRSPTALEFHHVDPAQKLFQLSIRGRTVGIEKLRTEAQKCVLLCATCHAEVEAGDTKLPLKLTAGAGDSK